MSCHLTSCDVLSRLVISCHLAREACSRIFPPSLLLWRRGGPDEVFETVALCGNPARSDALAVAPRALRACACGAVHIFATWASFCVAGCGDRACWRCIAGVLAGVPRLCRGDWVPGVFCARMANVRFAWQAAGIVRAGSVLGACWRAVSAAPCRGDWVRGVSRARAHALTRCDLRFAWQVWDFGCIEMRSGRHWTVDPRGRRDESCAVAKIAGFRGPVRQIACAGARWALRNRGRRRESVFADVSLERTFLGTQRQAASGVSRLALCRGTQWQAVTMGVGRVARVARAALCHGDCCWACRVGAAVPWRLLLGVSRGWRCAMGIAAGRLAWVSLCHGDCWAACPLGGAVS